MTCILMLMKETYHFNCCFISLRIIKDKDISKTQSKKVIRFIFRVYHLNQTHRVLCFF